jgi:hypothetical protein
MDILFVRLNRGDDIISEVTLNEEEDTILLHNPLKVVYATIPNSGVMSVNLIPWTFSRLVDTNDFVIFTDHVLTMTKASNQITEYYKKSLTVFADLQAQAKTMQDAYEADDAGLFEDEFEEFSEAETVEELEQLMNQGSDYKKRMH